MSQYTSPNCTDYPQVNIRWIHCIENFSPFRIFEHLALALKNRVCPEIFDCIEYIFYHSRILCNFALALKNRVCTEILHYIEYTFYIQDFWVTFACPQKQTVPCSNSLYWIYIFYHSGFLSNLRLPWKQSCPEIFHCIECTFYIHDFWATCACREKESVPWIHCVECSIYLLSFRILEQLALALKIQFALKFFKSVELPSPRSRTPMGITFKLWSGAHQTRSTTKYFV